MRTPHAPGARAPRTPVVVRPATLPDVDAVVQLGAIPELTWGDEHHLTEEDYAAHVPSAYFLVAERGGIVVGFLMGEPLMNRGVILWTMAVAPSTRGSGIGTALLRSLTQQAREDGCAWIYATMSKRNRRLRAYYEREGWEFGQDVVEMVRSL